MAVKRGELDFSKWRFGVSYFDKVKWGREVDREMEKEKDIFIFIAFLYGPALSSF
jgi:hypothetical protein